MNQSDVTPFCESLAAQHDGWIYHGRKFKNKTLAHSEIQINPKWVLHLSAEPAVFVYNKSIKKIYKESFAYLAPPLGSIYIHPSPQSQT